jgi:hypothetical protein
VAIETVGIRDAIATHAKGCSVMDRTTITNYSTRRTFLRGTLGLALMAGAVGLQRSTSLAHEHEAVKIDLNNDEIAMDDVTFKAGTTYSLQVKNHSRHFRKFAVLAGAGEELAGLKSINPNQTLELVVAFPKADRYQLQCHQFGGYMVQPKEWLHDLDVG